MSLNVWIMLVRLIYNLSGVISHMLIKVRYKFYFYLCHVSGLGVWVTQISCLLEMGEFYESNIV